MATAKRRPKLADAPPLSAEEASEVSAETSAPEPNPPREPLETRPCGECRGQGVGFKGERCTSCGGAGQMFVYRMPRNEP